MIDDLLDLLDAIQVPIDAADRQLTQAARDDPRVKTLRPLPGVGPLTALTILAEIGDITRFPSARKLAAWAGLTLTVRSSDRTVHHGHISKQGSPHLRWILTEAAHIAIRSPEFHRFYLELSHRRGKKIAITAVARKLLTRAYHLLAAQDQTSAAMTAPNRECRQTRARSHPCMSRHHRAR